VIDRSSRSNLQCSASTFFHTACFEFHAAFFFQKAYFPYTIKPVITDRLQEVESLKKIITEAW